MSTMKPIYEPKGKANEYCELALNIYDTCNHGCTYCWSRAMHERWHGKGSFDKQPEPRAGLLEAMEKQLATGNYKDKLIHLCFTCDPYPAPPVDTTITREVISLLKAYGCHVQILTKGGNRAERDFGLLDENDWFGVTISSGCIISAEHEPNAAGYFERVASLRQAHKLGVKTWVSCEPVLNKNIIYHLLSDCFTGQSIDLYRIGKLNYHPSNINWGDFGRECERLAIEHGRNIYIKDDLKKEMEKRA